MRTSLIAILLLLAAAVMLLATSRGTADDPSPPPPLYAADYRPAVWVPMAPVTNSEDNPHGLQRDWLDPETAETWLRQQLARGDRVILKTPCGQVPGPVSSKQWYPCESWRRELLVDVLNEWLDEEPGRTVSLFIGCRVGNPYELPMINTAAPDPEYSVALENFLATVGSWLEAVPLHRVWLDHASHHFNVAAVVSLADWCRENLDLTIGMEAVPVDFDQSPPALDFETMRHLPVLCTWRFAHQHDPDLGWEIPPGYEAVVVVKPQPDAPPPTAEAVRSFRRRHWTLASGNANMDEFVLRPIGLFEPAPGGVKEPGAAAPGAVVGLPPAD